MKHYYSSMREPGLKTTVIGSPGTSKSALVGIAEAIERVVPPGTLRDTRTITFGRAMRDPDMVEREVCNGLVVTHGVGIRALHKNTRPWAILACNGPEPRPRREIIRGEFQRDIGGHWMRLGSLLAASDFSTRQFLQSLQNPPEGVHKTLGYAAVLVSETDELYPHQLDTDYGQVATFVHEGGHDALLTDPKAVLGTWAAKTEIPAWQLYP